MTSDEFSTTAKDIIKALDEMPATPQRAKHKFNMIRLAERVAAEIEIDDDAATEEVLAAASFAGV